MACYASVVSLKQTIEHIRHSCNNVSLEIIQFAYDEVRSVQKLLQEFDVRSRFIETSSGSNEMGSYEWKDLDSVSAILKRGESSESRGFRADGCGIQRMNALDGKMREAACELEDALETHVVNLISHHELLFSRLDLRELKKDIDSFSQTVKQLKEEYIKEEDDGFVLSRIDFRGNNESTKMVGFSDVFRRIQDELLEDVWRVNIGSLVGMAGLGKTTLAHEFFEDSSVVNWFDHRAWVTVGPKYQLIDVVRRILNQVNPNTGNV